jgi:N-methylhydantoinase A/oxoprolinase/acetone carboxylase beta subunit
MVIGIRSFPDGFAYVILDGSQARPVCIAKDRLNLPVGVSWPEALAWVRRQVEEIMNAHQAVRACIKIIEHNAKRKSVQRSQIEAVILEYLFSSHHICCEARVKAQIKRAIPRFHEQARYLDRLVASHAHLRDLDTLTYQEATVAGISMLSEN